MTSTLLINETPSSCLKPFWDLEEAMRMLLTQAGLLASQVALLEGYVCEVCIGDVLPLQLQETLLSGLALIQFASRQVACWSLCLMTVQGS